MFPKLFSLFGFNIHTYGFLLAVAFLVAIWTAMRRSEKAGIPKQRILDLGIWILISSIIGGKLLLILINWRYYYESPRNLVETLRVRCVLRRLLSLRVCCHLVHSQAQIIVLQGRRCAVSIGPSRSVFCQARLFFGRMLLWCQMQPAVGYFIFKPPRP